MGVSRVGAGRRGVIRLRSRLRKLVYRSEIVTLNHREQGEAEGKIRIQKPGVRIVAPRELGI
jgi:hypothetical protein